MSDRVALSKIRLDGGTQPRAELREDVIEDYAEEMRRGVEFPPVTAFYDGDVYWLADGFHRVRAARLAGKGDIPADVQQGTRRDAVLYSVGANAEHGLRRSNSDKRRAVMTLLRDEDWSAWSDREIARRCAVSNWLVSSMRKEVTVSNSQLERKYVTKHGTVATMNAGNIGGVHAAQNPEHRAAKILETSRERRAAKLARALDSAPLEVIEVVEEYGIDDAEVVEGLKRLHKSNGKPDSNNTFDEVKASGYIQPGDEGDAVHITESPVKVAGALRLKSSIHAGLARDEKEAIWLSSESNEWYTPQKYIDAARQVLGDFDLDPASSVEANKSVGANAFYTRENSGLVQHWRGRVWLNPPYGGQSGPFVSKLIEEVGLGNVTAAIVLVNANSTETKWFAPLWCYTLCFTNHRIDFVSPTGARNGSTHGSIFAYIGPDKIKFARVFQQFGYVVERVQIPPVISSTAQREDRRIA